LNEHGVDNIMQIEMHRAETISLRILYNTSLMSHRLPLSLYEWLMYCPTVLLFLLQYLMDVEHLVPNTSFLERRVLHKILYVVSNSDTLLVSFITLFINKYNNRSFHCCGNSSLFWTELISLWISEWKKFPAFYGTQRFITVFTRCPLSGIYNILSLMNSNLLTADLTPWYMKKPVSSSFQRTCPSPRPCVTFCTKLFFTVRSC